MTSYRAFWYAGHDVQISWHKKSAKLMNGNHFTSYIILNEKVIVGESVSAQMDVNWNEESLRPTNLVHIGVVDLGDEQVKDDEDC